MIDFSKLKSTSGKSALESLNKKLASIAGNESKDGISKIPLQL